MECKTKRVAAYKTDNMVRNALEMHVPIPGAQRSGVVVPSYGRALLNFRTQEDVYERVGGFMWAWRKILNGTIFTEEGIWLHSRLFIANLSQFFIATFMVSFLISASSSLAVADCEADPNDEALCAGEAPPTWSPTMTPSVAPSTQAEWSEFTGLFPGNPIADQFYEFLYVKSANETLVYDIFFWLGWIDEDGYPLTESPTVAPIVSNLTETPADDDQTSNDDALLGVTFDEVFSLHSSTKSSTLAPIVSNFTGPAVTFRLRNWEVNAMVYGGSVFAFLAIVLVASMLLPSTISTILQYRCGMIGSLRDPEFNLSRQLRKFRSASISRRMILAAHNTFTLVCSGIGCCSLWHLLLWSLLHWPFHIHYVWRAFSGVEPGTAACLHDRCSSDRNRSGDSRQGHCFQFIS
jgi:hypothetical protein